MLTVQQITDYTEIQIKQLSLKNRIDLQDDLTRDNNHTAVILIDAVVQSNQTVIDLICAIYTLQTELGYLPIELATCRNFLSTLLTK
jgi:hypothetical protein